jgi:hypothetical protein
MPLSGKFRMRKSSFGGLVLQVEDVRRSWPWSKTETPRWRDAKPLDLAATELRGLIDLGNGGTPRSARAPSSAAPSGTVEAAFVDKPDLSARTTTH